MVLYKCLEDPFLKEYSSKVVSCEPAKYNSNGTLVEGYEATFEDTILFPEGGGQPCDTGLVDGKPVLNVYSKDSKAVHFVSSDVPLTVGDTVKQTVDWDRRQDHMQQHSGQHLISALFTNEFNINTASWWLGVDTSYIETDAKSISQEQLSKVEELCNKAIREQTIVNVVLIEDGQEIPENLRNATKALPDDFTPPIRVICIDGIDNNMCCGTHVRNLSQLQFVKLLQVEKKQNKCFVHFVVGQRAVRKMDEMFKKEQKMNLILNGGPSAHIDLIQKIQANLKDVLKIKKRLLKEIATNEAQGLAALPEKPKYYFLHRSDGIEPDFINTFLRGYSNLETFCFITIGDDSNKGQLMCHGKKEVVAELGPILSEILSGKGNCSGNKFQGKVNDLSKLHICHDKIKQFFV